MVGGEFIDIILISFLFFIFWTSTPIINKNCSRSVTCVIYNLGEKILYLQFLVYLHAAFLLKCCVLSWCNYWLVHSKVIRFMKSFLSLSRTQLGTVHYTAINITFLGFSQPSQLNYKIYDRSFHFFNYSFLAIIKLLCSAKNTPVYGSTADKCCSW